MINVVLRRCFLLLVFSFVNFVHVCTTHCGDAHPDDLFLAPSTPTAPSSQLRLLLLSLFFKIYFICAKLL